MLQSCYLQDHKELGMLEHTKLTIEQASVNNSHWTEIGKNFKDKPLISIRYWWNGKYIDNVAENAANYVKAGGRRMFEQH